MRPHFSAATDRRSAVWRLFYGATPALTMNKASARFRQPRRGNGPARASLFPLRHPGLDPGSRFPTSLSRSEEHTSELQSLMRISYAVICLKKKKTPLSTTHKVPNPKSSTTIQTHQRLTDT